jgi:spoIIIJ-associated protein
MTDTQNPTAEPDLEASDVDAIDDGSTELSSPVDVVAVGSETVVAGSDDGTDDDGTDDGGSGDDDDADDEPSSSLLVREGDIAADYLERLLDIVDYDGDIDLDVENDRAIVAIVGTGLQSLVGPQGKTLDALQELTRLAVHQKTGVRSRLMLDVSGHRQARRGELGALAAETAREVLDSGQSVKLVPMNPFERKVVHDVIGSIDGVRSDSEGEEPNRCVVVLLDQ